jgi:hypothetical protein
MASEWLAQCLICCVLGVPAPWLTDDSRLLFDIITGKVIDNIFHPWLFENLEQLFTLSGVASKTEVICWLSHDCVHYFYCFVAKVKIM